MPINPELLIAAPMLQDYFVDKDFGTPLSAGIVTFYEDTARTVFKNVYEQTGSPGAYTYVPLPNPLTLSAVGTIQDNSGNDVIPYYYPFDEDDSNISQPYYVTVTNSLGVPQFTRENFPFIGDNGENAANVSTLQNQIVNNVFWRNVGSINVTNLTNTVIAPSQHDGFSMPDVRFIKNINGATDNITFIPFGLGNDPLVNDITPEVYLNFDCSAAQVGETSKYIQIPISYHIKTLENVPATITLQAQNVTGNTNNTLTISILQFLGTGAISQPAPIVLETITLNNSWEKFVIPFVFPSAAGLTLSGTGDDALYLQINYPVAVTCDINFCLPSNFLSNVVPTNSFQTYDQIDPIINGFRTGDYRMSLNSFSPFGWVGLNDGTIGNVSSNSTTRANIDTWPLFNLIWNAVGATNAPMFTSGGAPVGYGANAMTDFTANRQLSLTKTLGRLIASIGTPSSGNNTGTNWALGQTSGNEQHAIALNEIPDHAHNSPANGLFVTLNPGTAAAVGGNCTSSNITGTINSYTSQTFMNIQNPTFYTNMFLKL
jgi:hypothetical protein